MACAYVKIEDRRLREVSAKNVTVMTPTTGIEPDHILCKLSPPGVTIEVEFSRREIAEMVATLPGYIPTMDAVIRFMRSNPRTSKEMIEAEAEIYYRNTPDQATINDAAKEQRRTQIKAIKTENGD